MDRIGVFFGGKSTEHEVSCISATAVIKAIDKDKHDLVYIGINKKGKWFRYDGPVDNIADGSWEQTAEPLNMGDLPDLIDFALPIMHGAYGEDGKLQGVFEMLDIPYAGCGVLGSALAMDKEAAKLCPDQIIRPGDRKDKDEIDDHAGIAQKLIAERNDIGKDHFALAKR